MTKKKIPPKPKRPVNPLADRLAKALGELLRTCPTVGCAYMHHPSKDQHSDDEPCPVEERYKDAIAKALESINTWKEARKP